MRLIDFAKLQRPQFLIAGLALNMLGTLVALHLGASMDWAKFALFQVVVFSSQLAGACANELVDVGSDRLNKNRTWFSGGSGVLVSGRVARKTIVYVLVLWTALMLAASLILTFALETGITSLLLMIMGLVLALSYSLKPMKLSFIGLGELAMAFMCSILTPAVAFYVISGRFDNLIVLVTAPIVFQMLGLMMVVENPDMEADLAAGKMNLVVRLGRVSSWNLGILMLVLGGLSALTGSMFGLPTKMAAASSTVLITEALVFWAIGNLQESRSKIFWSTAISCGFYVLVILLMAWTISQ